MPEETGFQRGCSHCVEIDPLSGIDFGRDKLPTGKWSAALPPYMRSGGVMPIRFRAVLMVCLVTLVSSRRAARAPMSSSRMRRS